MPTHTMSAPQDTKSPGSFWDPGSFTRTPASDAQRSQPPDACNQATLLMSMGRTTCATTPISRLPGNFLVYDKRHRPGSQLLAFLGVEHRIHADLDAFEQDRCGDRPTLELAE